MELDRQRVALNQINQMIIAACTGIFMALLAAIVFGVQSESLTVLLLRQWPSTIVLVVYLLLNALFGIFYLALFSRITRRDYVQPLMTGAVYGLVWWIFVALILLPVLLGQGAQWQVQEAARQFPALIRYLFQGMGVGLALHLLSGWLRLSDEPHTARPSAPVRHRIVILGGGFGGVATAQHLEHRFPDDEDVEIVLVSDTNYLLFTPMLSEVVAGSVEPQHTSSPLRSFFKRTRLVRAKVERVDLDDQVVHLVAKEPSFPTQLPYEHLVLAVGASPDFFGNHSIQRHAFTFKNLDDAIRLRNHVIEMLERADVTSDAEQRKQMLTFVVAGAGFAGTELAGALNDFVRGALYFYPNILPEEISPILVHSRERILPELSPELAAFAQQKLEERGVIVKLNVRATEAGPDGVVLSSAEAIPTKTLVWTAGNQANPLLAALAVETDRRGRVQTTDMLTIPDRDGLWGVGDCAAIPNRETGEMAPPTAQHATREAAIAAHNIYARIRGKPLKSFVHRDAGSLAVLGHQTACAELYGVRFSGMLAWWMWRAVYLSKLPTFQKKTRVAMDWLVDLFFPRDIVDISSGTPSTQSEPDKAVRKGAADTIAVAEQDESSAEVSS